jgi:hypothetical protein
MGSFAMDYGPAATWKRIRDKTKAILKELRKESKKHDNHSCLIHTVDFKKKEVLHTKEVFTFKGIMGWRKK